MMNCVGKKSSPRSKSFNSASGVFNVDLPELKLLHKQTTSFWKKKCFLFSIILTTCTVLGLFTFLVIDKISNKGDNTNNIVYNLYDPLVNKIKNSFKPLENYSKASPVFQQRIRRFQTDLDEIHEQEISVTCDLKNGIKELNNEIKRLYDSLTRLDYHVNRDRRGINEQTAIADCVQMKGKFKKIYEDLNRISETLLMIDENGICRCKCPLEKITSTTTEVTHITDLPLELTTFSLENINEQSVSDKKTKQLKQIILTDYKPHNIANNIINNEFRGVTEEEIINVTTIEEIELSSTSIIENITNQKETTMTTESKEDMSQAMSNAVTSLINYNNYTQTVEPQTEPPTSHSELVTKSYEDLQIFTSEASKSSTEITSTNEDIKTTKFPFDEIFTTQKERPDKVDILKLTIINESISEPTTEIFDSNQNDSNSNVVKSDFYLMTTNENNLKLTTEIPDFDKNYRNTYTTEITFESTDTNENISNPTTDPLNYDKTSINIGKQKYFQLTTTDEKFSESTIEIMDFDKSNKNTYTTEAIFDVTTSNENTLELSTEISDSDKNYSNTYVTENNFMLSTINENTSRFTTEVLGFKNNNKSTDIKPTTILENRDTNNVNKIKNKELIDQSRVEKTDMENENKSKLSNYFENNTFSEVVKTQTKWYPICFYPIPCSPNFLNYQQKSLEANKNSIQYFAQSLNTHKKKSPVADATVIYNNYPILSYCPIGMVCPMTDFAGQANMLHCMLKYSFPNTSTNANKNNENISNQIIKNNYNETKNPVIVRAKNARDSDEILTGNLECPINTLPCVDNSRCVDIENWCDGRVHCDDASDESQCNCKERIDKDKLCDGYYDCPSGEDELGCFGCNNETFSCGDWNIVSQQSSCFERQNRCDLIRHCPNGRDEDECTLLSKNLENPNQIFFVSYSTGYLHHNWRGNWYPMCDEGKIETWAEEACAVESGEKFKPNKIQHINELTTYEGPYISIDRNDQVKLLDSCKSQGVLIECEPEVCGIRSDLKLKKNIDPDRIRRNSDLENAYNITSRFVRSKDPRVVGGVASNPGAWPWLIALYQDGIFHCGGVILNEQWVLTAAHCVSQYQKHFYEVQAGILRRFSFSPMEQSRIVTHVIVHTQYVRTTMENDLAILRLERSLEFNRWIRPVCLPDPKLDWIPFAGTICTAVGWGATVEHGLDPDNMREVEVPILPECTHKTDIDGKEICAGYLSGGHDTCQGDSGGPLLCREPNNLNKWYVAGIVSHGEGCARPMEPGVYTRVALFVDWIIKVTEENNLPQIRPQQYCPGIRCKTGKQCIPKKRQCDKYVDCMNAEDEQNCDYTGSQYNVNFYRSRNTDRSNLKYSKLKSVGEQDKNITDITSKPKLITIYQDTSTTLIPTFKTNNRDNDVNAGISPIKIEVKNNTKLNETILNALKQLFDNQFAEETFSCGRITQVVLSKHRCDGKIDCEDGSDEMACDCKTRLENMYNSSAICDGIVDCHDGVDEKGCGEPECKTDEMVCGQPKKCIKKKMWCDGVIDCFGDGSDEKYCTAITNGTTAVVSDETGRPALRRSGMVAVNYKGVWKVLCVNDNTATKVAHETCSNLHFLNSEYNERKMSWNSPLPLNMKRLKFTDMCQGLYVECGPKKTVDVSLYHWHVDIVVDGRLLQSGVLIKSSWVLVKRTCLNLKKEYATAVLGRSTYSSINIKSPYEQIIRIDGIREIPDTDQDLLHLASPAILSRGVTPLDIPLFQPSPKVNHTCYAVGYSNSHKNKTEIALLRPETKQYDYGNACLTVSRKPQSCLNGKNMSNVTAIVCESDFGLFLATPSIPQNINFCDRNARIQLSSVEDLLNKISSITDEKIKSTPAPNCDGKRCLLGDCVPWKNVCDGVPNCRDEQDETITMCDMRATKCKSNDTLCICNVGSFRCANGKCVEKSAFCDGFDDCGDRSDEPQKCQQNPCVEYLRLTAPKRLCDGRWDCLDKTDEKFENCPANYCNRTNVYQCQSSNKCIPTELVCDGEEDCAESDDEAECIGLISPAKKKYSKNEGILAIRSYGNWHAQCITEDYTNVDYHSLCKGLGFKYAMGIKKIASTKVDFENFTMVQLNAITDVTVRSATKNIISHTDQPCTAVYVVCSSS